MAGALSSFYKTLFKKSKMKYLLAFFLLLLAVALPAQSSRTSMSETISDDNYEFRVKVDKSRLPDLQWCFNQLTDQPEIRTISGVATYEKDGLTIEFNTWKRRIIMFTDAVNEAAVADAKAKARIIKEKLKAPKAPEPPADDWRD